MLQKTVLLSCKNVLKVHKESISPLLVHQNYSTENITLIETQWRAINYTQWNNITDTLLFWSEVREYEDSTGTNPFKELCDFAFSVLLLPYSNAEVERVFSVMNAVKSKLRNKMKENMVNAILTIRSGLKRTGKTCYSYNLPDKIISMVGTMQTYGQPQPSTSAVPEPEEQNLESDDDLHLDF